MTRLLASVFRHPGVQSLLLPSSRAWRVAPALGWAVLIFVLSSIPGNHYPEVRIVQFDKVVHFLLYLPLGIGLGRAVGPTAARGRQGLRGTAVPVLLGAAYGASDELHQLSVANRSCTLSDWIIDVLAVWTGVLLWRLIEKRALAERAPVRSPIPTESA